jgi:hypothetical protein
MAIFIFRYTFEWWVNLFLTIIFTDNQWDAFVSVILSLENFPPYILSYNNKNKYLGKYLWPLSREANVSFRNSSRKAKTFTQGQIIITHQVWPIIVIGIDVCLPWRLQNKPYMRDKCKVIKFVSDLWQGGSFLRVLQFPLPINLTHYIIEILLKVALNTIN